MNLRSAASFPAISDDQTDGDVTVGGTGKRMFDIGFVFVTLPLLIPLLALIAAAIRLFCGGQVLFRQKRVGLNGDVFYCLKFRTMVLNAEEKLDALIESDPAARAEYEKTHKLRNDPRILPVIGNLLRRSSLDELPQFINVLRGDMSVVGPRPVMRAEFEILDDPHAQAYMSARPGITGRWQVSGRNELDFSERAALDEAYVRDWSFRHDVRIILNTVIVLVMCKGAY